MATANDITDRAYRICHIVSPTSDQDSFALLALNALLALWSAKGLMIPFLTDDNHTLSAGTASYTIGSSGTINTARPIKIVEAYIQDSASVDYPVETNMTLDEYNRIADKSAQSRPTRLYYDPEYPLGKIYLDPNPDAAYELYISSLKQLPSFASISATMVLPAEYEKALSLSLAVDLAPELNVVLSQVVIQQAIGALLDIMALNSPVVGGVRHDDAIVYQLY